jgi:hypothetical protein
MEATRSSETTTWRYIPEDRTFQTLK